MRKSSNLRLLLWARFGLGNRFNGLANVFGRGDIMNCITRNHTGALGVLRAASYGVARSLAGLLFLLGATSLASADEMTYDVNQTIVLPGDRATGYIVTDGKIGVLAETDILSWNLLLNVGTNTFDLTSVTAPFVIVGGSDLSATATHLLFNFSGGDQGYFEIGDKSSGRSVFGVCFNADEGCPTVPDSGTGVAIDFSPPGLSGEGTDAAGTQVIGTVPEPSTPEPSSLLLLGSGLLVLMALAARSKRHAPPTSC